MMNIAIIAGKDAYDKLWWSKVSESGETLGYTDGVIHRKSVPNGWTVLPLKSPMSFGDYVLIPGMDENGVFWHSVISLNETVGFINGTHNTIHKTIPSLWTASYDGNGSGVPSIYTNAPDENWVNGTYEGQIAFYKNTSNNSMNPYYWNGDTWNNTQLNDLDNLTTKVNNLSYTKTKVISGDYTLEDTDSNTCLIVDTSLGNIIINVPGILIDGFVCTVLQINTSSAFIQSSFGAIINDANGYTQTAQFTPALIQKYSPNSFVTVGLDQ